MAQEKMRFTRHRGIPRQSQTLGPLAPECVPLTTALASSPQEDRDKQLLQGETGGCNARE